MVFYCSYNLCYGTLIFKFYIPLRCIPFLQFLPYLFNSRLDYSTTDMSNSKMLLGQLKGFSIGTFEKYDPVRPANCGATTDRDFNVSKSLSQIDFVVEFQH